MNPSLGRRHFLAATGTAAAAATVATGVASVRQEARDPLRFTARADDEDVTLLPIARVHHQHYSVYWLTGEPPSPPPEFAAWHRSTRPRAARPATPPGTAGRPG